MTKRNIASLLFLLVFGLTACGGPAAQNSAPAFREPVVSASPTVVPTAAPVPTRSPTPESTPFVNPLLEQMAAMTDEELVGQLLVAGIEGTTPGEDARTAIQDLHVGGIILFGRNVESGDQLTALNTALKEMNGAAGNIPLFLCVDEEGGPVSRLAPLEGRLPSAYDYIAGGGEAEELGRTLAERCAKYGFHVDFAPVLDVWSNPDNTVIGKRAFGTDAETASLAVDTALAMTREGIIPVGKHFPGHGDTFEDSHVGLPVVDKAQLETLEYIPFRAAINAGIPALMVGHILAVKIDPEYPASVSPAVVDFVLRDFMGFDGVVFTDDLTMGAITQTYGIGEAAVMSINAGCDVALVCHGADNVKEAHAALLAAMADGTLSRERAEESVARILKLKTQFGVT